MPTSIETFRLFTEYVSNKSQSGNTVPVSKLNMLAHRAQMHVFEKDFQTFLQTGIVSEYLSFFLKNQTVTVPPTTGYLTYPSDFEHIASLRAYYVRPDGESTEIPVEEVKNESWGAISTSQLQKPTKRFPKFSEFSDGIRFLPRDIGSVMMDYFKTPREPVWGFTVASGRYVYDPTTSVNFEWDEFSLNNVASVYLSYNGVNLKDGQLIEFAEMYKQQTNSVL